MRVTPEQVYIGDTAEPAVGRAIEQLGRFSVAWDVVTVSASATIDPQDDLMVSDTNSIVITLPKTADAQRKPYVVVNASGGNIVVAVNGGDTAGNWTSALLLTANARATFVHDNDGTVQTGVWYQIG